MQPSDKHYSRSAIYFTRVGSSIKWPTLNKEATLGPENWGVVYHGSSYEITLSFNIRFLNRCIFMGPTVVCESQLELGGVTVRFPQWL